MGSFLSLLLAVIATAAVAQNSMVGDGFGGRLWYRPTNYAAGSLSALSLCFSDPCDSSSTQLYGWGTDIHGQLGNGIGGGSSEVPVPIAGVTDVRYFTACIWSGVIKNNGTGWVWHDPEIPFPTQVISDVKFMCAGDFDVSFVKEDGTIWSLGANYSGEFGDGTVVPNYSAPVQMNGVANAVRTAYGRGGAVAYALLADSTVLSVGSSVYGLRGDPAITDPFTTQASPIPGLSGILDIRAHSYAAAALDANGDVFGWGQAVFNGLQNWDTVPHRIDRLRDIVAISGNPGGINFMALDAYGNCYMWGGIFSNDLTIHAQEPLLVATDVIDIMAGETYSYIVKSDGTLWAMGRALFGSIWLGLPALDGNGVAIVRPQFVQLDPSLVPSACPLVGTMAVPDMACDNGGGTITVSHFGGQAPYQYDIGNGPQGSPVFTGLPVGDYTVTVTDANSCTTTATCSLIPSDVPVVQLSYAQACNLGYPLPWGGLALASGTYTDTVFSVSGCDTVHACNVIILDNLTASLQHELCAGQAYTLPSGLVVSAPGVYSDTVPGVACDTVFTVTLSPGDALSVSIAITDDVIVLGESTTLFASGGDGYLWSPAAGLSCTTCQDPVASPTESTVYCVVASNDCSSDTACVSVAVQVPSCTSASIYMPSAFSPDASGRNDAYCLYGTDCIATMQLDVYDRWGNRVFASTDSQACWDGTYNGQPLDPAVFVYHLSATLHNGESVERQGNITLMR